MTDTPVHKASADLAGEFEFNLPKGFDLIAEDPELGPKIVESLAEIEQRLSRAVENTNHLADVASRHLLDAGGKRVRPLLTLLAAAAGGEINDKVLDAAVVVELTHLATLYHDDVMDDAPKRRGVDTAQTIWGNSVAILTGDLIFARASLIVSELGARALAIQARTFERLVLGQLFETTGPQNGDDLYNHYIKVIEGKTGSLISAAGEYGTVLAEAPESAVQMLVRYGELVGVAFQLADDVIDLTGGTAAGKTPGTDLREGVPTLPTILLAQEAEAGDEEAQRIQTMISGGLSSDAALADAVAALSAHPVTQKAWDIAYSWADEAIAAIEPLPDSTAKEALKSFAHAVVKREI
ncbi:polyprenyl synthetase family protein [Rothia terrae]|uniref:Polyprenyl synthetase family protein n=1 Tax=Rothia terrae TaxID=396015 RepID=A0A7H2BEX2_9MICC|nr:polyprenyl synthetase family protein [Rothia terrae]MDT0189888.1 polyprenyl synthetase family protein [Rothia terrae]QNV38218.1 polyprenyl synthetase family protein [Rothia terrae]